MLHPHPLQTAFTVTVHLLPSATALQLTVTQPAPKPPPLHEIALWLPVAQTPQFQQSVNSNLQAQVLHLEWLLSNFA